MTRRSWIQDPVTHKLIPKEEYESPPEAGFFVMGDINPYKSMVTGEMIQGRAQHREHLRRHNVVEVGNSFDKLPQKQPETPKGLKQTLIDVVNSRT
jgi:ribosomal protein L35AE/L33A